VVTAVFALALALRLALVPLTQGFDFIAYQRLLNAVVHGRDVYAIPPSELLPWAYLPLCFDLYRGLQWLSGLTGWSFVILGKLPVVGADLLIGWLLYRGLRRRGHAAGRALLAAALYLFNPLVLYNGAFYGRFDALALAFLLLALEEYHGRIFAPAFALAISAKTFPLFVLPLLLCGRDRQSGRRLLLALVLVAVLALPSLVSDLPGLVAHQVYAREIGGRLSWYTLLVQSHRLSTQTIHTLAQCGLLLYPVATLTLRQTPRDVKVAGACALFLVFSSVVYEQYLLWALPFLIVVGLHYRDRLALYLLLLFTAAGLIENEFTWAEGFPWAYRVLPQVITVPSVPLNLLLALSIIVAVGTWGTKGRAARW